MRHRSWRSGQAVRLLALLILLVFPNPAQGQVPGNGTSNHTDLPYEPPEPDFSVLSIKPVQVVWDSDINEDGKIDLVAGKSTMVRVEVGMKDYEALDKQQQVEVRLTFEGISYFERRTIEQLEQNDKIDFYPSNPAITGDQVITAKVDPEHKIIEADETNNENYAEITVKDTKGLYLISFPVRDSNGNKPDTLTYDKTVIQGGDFILGTYPIAGQMFKNELSEEEFQASDDLTNNVGRMNAFLRLWLIGKRATNGQNDVAIGIVPTGALGQDTHGISPAKVLKFGAVFVEEKYWTVAAHEVGHLYGLWRWKEENDIPEYASGKPSNGFWVDKRSQINKTWCFMSYFVPWETKYPDWNWILEKRAMQNWIDKEDYASLVREFRIDQTDPEILIIGGIISKNGSIQFVPSYIFPSGVIDNGEIGNYSIKTFNTAGEFLGEIPFDISFQLHTTPGGIVETDSAPFGFSIPYTPDTARVEIRNNNQTIAEIEPTEKLLNDAVDLIPDYGFINNPEQRRNSLHNKIDAMERMIAENNTKGAIQKLQYDIKDKFEKWLVDGYQREDLLQYTKEDILNLSDRIIERLFILEKK